MSRLGLVVLLILIFCLTAQAAEVRVAAASDLNNAIKEIAAVFEKATSNKVSVTLGSSGNFYAQLTNGAPFDVFLSADVDYPKRLEAAGLTDKGSVIVYAIGKIVLWVPNGSGIDPQKTQMKTLVDPQIKRISIANPEHAPYGRAAVSAMRQAGVYETVKNKLVFGENISQAAQFVQSGAADAGIIALSLARGEPMRAGRYWEIPVNAYPRIEQAAVVLKNAPPAARSFVDWLRRPDAREILTRYGFALP